MEDKNYKELVDFLADQFNKVHIKLDYLSEHKADKSDVENKADKSDFRQLLNAVDAYAHKADTYFMEMAALGNKVDRLEKWINQLAEKVGIKLG